MELGPQEVVLLSEIVHERLERARRRSKKVRKKDRLAHHQLIHQLGDMQRRLDEVRVTELVTWVDEAGARADKVMADLNLDDPVPPPTVE